MDLVSIIVPIYNTQKFLPRCIESIMNQTYKNIEIILIDDGSIDKSSKICDKYAKKDNRIKTFHKQNEGVSVARNFGINKAEGRFIAFVDSDDFVREDYITVLFNAMENNDLAVSSISDIDLVQKKKFDYNEDYIEKYNFANVEDVEKFFCFQHLNWMGPCAKLFRTDIIRTNNILFPKNIKMGEDQIFVLDYMLRCKTVCYSAKLTYYYNRLNLHSATSKFYVDHIDMVKSVTEKLCNLMPLRRGEKNSFEWQSFLVNNFFVSIRHYAHGLKNIEDFSTIVKEIVKILYKYDIDIEKNNYFPTNKDKSTMNDYLIKSDYEGLYIFLNINLNNKKRKNWIKKNIICLLIAIKKIIIFDLKMGYRK